MKKSIYALLLCLLCVFGTVACGKTVTTNSFNVLHENAFRIVRKTKADESVEVSYIFPVNSEFLKENGFSEQQISTFKFYLTTYVNALAKTNKDKEVEGVDVGGCLYFTDIDGLGFTISFANLDAQKRFFNVENSEGESSSQKEISGFFIQKMTITSVFPIASQKTADDFRMICNMAISSWCVNESIPTEKKTTVIQHINEALFVYDFSTYQQGLKSDVMYQDSLYHNVFVKTYEQLSKQDNKIVFWVVSANRPVWYLSALLVVLIGMVCAFLCVRIKNKKKNRI